MIRHFSAALAVAAVGCLSLFPGTGSSQGKDGGWGTIKGRIVWGGKDIPPRPKIDVKQDQAHCLEKGPLYDENLVVNPKDQGIKWVFVWLAPEGANGALPIHPDLKTPKEKAVELDQPRCLFMPRAVAMREGQQLIVKNSAPVNHNIQGIGDGENNLGWNVTLPPGKSYTVKDLKPQKLPLILQCNIHPWMRARLAVFDHPYYAVTDEHGNFEIKNAPAGKFRLVGYQESIGWRGGAKGRKGQEITIKAGETTNLGDLPMGGN
jgi:hypothetical protein